VAPVAIPATTSFRPGHFLRRPDVGEPHPEELVTGVPVVLDRRRVDFQEVERREVVDPHRERVVREHETEARLRPGHLVREGGHPAHDARTDHHGEAGRDRERQQPAREDRPQGHRRARPPLEQHDHHDGKDQRRHR
jgi:hypothetical protein